VPYILDDSSLDRPINEMIASENRRMRAASARPQAVESTNARKHRDGSDVGQGSGDVDHDQGNITMATSDTIYFKEMVDRLVSENAPDSQRIIARAQIEYAMSRGDLTRGGGWNLVDSLGADFNSRVEADFEHVTFGESSSETSALTYP
jgi:hypothetical protein